MLKTKNSDYIFDVSIFESNIFIPFILQGVLNVTVIVVENGIDNSNSNSG